MDDASLLKVSLIVSCLGMMLLVGLDYWYVAPSMKIKEITLEKVGQEVIIKGELKSSYLKSGNLLFELSDDSGKIQGILFHAEESLKKGERVEVEGKVQRYKGNPEIVATAMKRAR